jgi:hypothetical protein
MRARSAQTADGSPRDVPIEMDVEKAAMEPARRSVKLEIPAPSGRNAAVATKLATLGGGRAHRWSGEAGRRPQMNGRRHAGTVRDEDWPPAGSWSNSLSSGVPAPSAIPH